MPRDPDSRNQTAVTTLAQLKEAQYFREMTGAQLRHLVTCGFHRRFQADTPLIEQGETLGSLFFVLQGTVCISVDVGATQPAWLYAAGPGSLADPCALLKPPMAPFTVYALSAVEALEIPRSCLVKELNERPELGYEIMQQLCERLRYIAMVTAKQGGNKALLFSPN